MPAQLLCLFNGIPPHMNTPTLIHSQVTRQTKTAQTTYKLICRAKIFQRAFSTETNLSF